MWKLLLELQLYVYMLNFARINLAAVSIMWCFVVKNVTFQFFMMVRPLVLQLTVSFC